MVGGGALEEATRWTCVASSGKQRGEGEVICFTFLVQSHPLLLFPTDNSGEVETAGTGDWPRPGPQSDLGRLSVAWFGEGGKAADEAAVRTFLTSPLRATAGSCLVSCWFCLFCFYAAALTPCP